MDSDGISAAWQPAGSTGEHVLPPVAELCPCPWVRARGRPQLLAPGVWWGALSTSPLQGNGTGEARDMYVPNPSCKEFAKYEWIGQIMGAALRGKEFLVSPMRGALAAGPAFPLLGVVLGTWAPPNGPQPCSPKHLPLGLSLAEPRVPSTLGGPGKSLITPVQSASPAHLGPGDPARDSWELGRTEAFQ